MVQSVSDHIGDRLALPGSRRAIKNKGSPHRTGVNRFDLA